MQLKVVFNFVYTFTLLSMWGQPLNSAQSAVRLVETPSDDEKIEVFIESEGVDEKLVLRYSTWTDGLGWCGQKTIEVAPHQIDDLQRAFTVARHRLARRRADNGDQSLPATVIRFPSLL
jgi:hypothetical protein